MGYSEEYKLTEVKVKACVQPKKSARSENVPHSSGGTRGFHQLDSFLLCNRIFQLPPNLPANASSSSAIDAHKCRGSPALYLDEFES